MISIKKNSSFPQWVQVFYFGEFVDEVAGRAKARRIAIKLAKENGQTHICEFGKTVEVKSPLKRQGWGRIGVSR